MGLFDTIDLNTMGDLEIPIGIEPKEEKEIDDGQIEIDAPKETKGKKADNAFDDSEFIEIDDIPKKNVVEDEDDDDIQDKTPPQNKKSNSSSSPFLPFAKTLNEEGFLADFTEDEFSTLSTELGGDMEALMELSRRSLQEEIEAYKKEQEDDYKAFLEAKESGVNINKWSDIVDEKKYYNSIKDDILADDVALQKRIVANYLSEKGFSKEEIDDTIETYEDTSKLETKATTALLKLKESVLSREKKLTEEKKLNDVKELEKRKETQTKLKSQIEAYKEIIPGIGINKQTKDKLYSSITQPAKEGPNGEQWNLATAKRMEDPMKYAILETYFVELGLFDGKFDKILAKTKTKALTSLEKVLSERGNTDFKTGKTIDEDEEYDAWKLPNL
jgi:hypothetical protein